MHSNINSNSNGNSNILPIGYNRNHSTESISNHSISSNNSSFYSKGGIYYFPNGEVFRPRTTPTSKRKNRPNKISTDLKNDNSNSASPIYQQELHTSGSASSLTQLRSNSYSRKQSLTKSIRSSFNDTPTNITIQEQEQDRQHPNNSTSFVFKSQNTTNNDHQHPNNSTSFVFKSQNTTNSEHLSNSTSTSSSNSSSLSSKSSNNHNNLEVTTSNTPSTSIGDEHNNNFPHTVNKTHESHHILINDRNSRESNLSLEDTTDDTGLSTLNEATEETFKLTNNKLDSILPIQNTEDVNANESRNSFKSPVIHEQVEISNENVEPIVETKEDVEQSNELVESHSGLNEDLSKEYSDTSNSSDYEQPPTKPILKQILSSSSTDDYKTPIKTPVDQQSFKEEDITPIQQIKSTSQEDITPIQQIKSKSHEIITPVQQIKLSKENVTPIHQIKSSSTENVNINGGSFVYEEPNNSLPDPTISLVESYLQDSPESQVIKNSASSTPKIKSTNFRHLFITYSNPTTPKDRNSNYFYDYNISSKFNKFINDDQKNVPPRGDVVVIDNGNKIRKHYRNASSTSSATFIMEQPKLQQPTSASAPNTPKLEIDTKDSTPFQLSSNSIPNTTKFTDTPPDTPPVLPPKSPNMKVKGRSRKKKSSKQVKSLLLDESDTKNDEEKNKEILKQPPPLISSSPKPQSPIKSVTRSFEKKISSPKPQSPVKSQPNSQSSQKSSPAVTNHQQPRKLSLPKSTSINFSSIKSFFKKHKKQKEIPIQTPVIIEDKRSSIISEVGRLPEFEPEKTGFLDELMISFDGIEKFENNLTPTKKPPPTIEISTDIRFQPFLKDDELTKDQIKDQQLRDSKNSSNEEINNENNDVLQNYYQIVNNIDNVGVSPISETFKNEEERNQEGNIRIDNAQLEELVNLSAEELKDLPPHLKYVKQFKDYKSINVRLKKFEDLSNVELNVNEIKLGPILKKGNDLKQERKRVFFANKISINETFSSDLYKRYNKAVTQYSLNDPKEINKIKNEVNLYKCNEMLVHESSQNNTHFYY
ncbi:unnamed protein product [Candida verbasci]|uniref:Uncharacterized protein n=1 Tax=Candida verbasci TaxID=1227364 RepID=A0A9W4XA98_9ASCO|nr:unnamed protein product [Candida verbasci]